MNKRNILLVGMIGLLSCGVSNQIVTYDDNNIIILYDNYHNRAVSLPPVPHILILKKNIKNPDWNTYESYCEVGNFSIVGKWKVEKDTLYLTPMGEYQYSSVPKLVELDPDKPEYFDISLIRQKWLIKGDRIYERTDYSVFNEYDENGNLLEDANRDTNPNNSLRLRSKSRLK